ncbi:MAG: nucleoside deaminase [Bdellovibrionales bacterium]
MDKSDITFMSAALEEAKLAFERDEVPIGAILVHKDTGEIVARAGNRTIELSDPTAHAEILCVRALCTSLGVQRLPDYDLYVTLEPCPMCASALSFARLNRVVFGAVDLKSGGLNEGLRLYEYPQLHHKPSVTLGVLSEECGQILKDFFKMKRA